MRIFFENPLQRYNFFLIRPNTYPYFSANLHIFAVLLVIYPYFSANLHQIEVSYMQKD